MYHSLSGRLRVKRRPALKFLRQRVFDFLDALAVHLDRIRALLVISDAAHARGQRLLLAFECVDFGYRNL